MLFTVDGLVQQHRVVPGQLGPLLHLLGVGALVTGADDDRALSGSAPPPRRRARWRWRARREPDAAYGRRVLRPDAGSATPLRRPAARAPLRPGRARAGAHRAAGPGVLVDGSAEALAGLAAFGALRPQRADPLRGRRRAAAAGACSRGGEVVVSDSNRRRVFSARARAELGPTLGADDPIPKDAPQLNPFGERGTTGRPWRCSMGPTRSERPSRPSSHSSPSTARSRPSTATRTTFWIADRNLRGPAPHRDRVRASRATCPISTCCRGARTRTTSPRSRWRAPASSSSPGWNRLPGARGVERLECAIRGRDRPEASAARARSRRCASPGSRARSRSARRGARAGARGPRPSRDGLSYLFARTTGDRPFRRQPSEPRTRPWSRTSPRVEPALVREARRRRAGDPARIDPPRGRELRAEAWVSVASDAGDEPIDLLAGYRGRSVSTLLGPPRGPARPPRLARVRRRPGDGLGRPRAAGPPWIEWRTPARPPSLASLRLARAARAGAGAGARAREWPRRAGPPLLGRADGGLVSCRCRLRARAFRLEVLDAPRRGRSASRSSTRRASRRREPRAAARSAAAAAICLSRRARARAALRVEGRSRTSTPGPAARRRLRRRARAAGRPPGRGVARRLVLPYLVRLRSAAARRRACRAPAGSVVDPGERRRLLCKGVRVELAGPPGSCSPRASTSAGGACDGDDLGEPGAADGFANGWDVPADAATWSSCSVRTARAPSATSLSGLACLRCSCCSRCGAAPGGRVERPPCGRARPASAASARPGGRDRPRGRRRRASCSLCAPARCVPAPGAAALARGPSTACSAPRGGARGGGARALPAPPARRPRRLQLGVPRRPDRRPLGGGRRVRAAGAPPLADAWTAEVASPEPRALAAPAGRFAGRRSSSPQRAQQHLRHRESRAGAVHPDDPDLRHLEAESARESQGLGVETPTDPAARRAHDFRGLGVPELEAAVDVAGGLAHGRASTSRRTLHPRADAEAGRSTDLGADRQPRADHDIGRAAPLRARSPSDASEDWH